MRYFTSDLHFGHKGVIEYCDRPFADVQEMNAGLIDMLNSVDGDVWILGDFCFLGAGAALDIVSQINNPITIVRGNHDNSRVLRRLEEVGVTIMDTHDGNIGRHGVTFSHYPFNDDRYPERSPQDDGRILIHGHTHGTQRVVGNQVHVGYDAWHRLLTEDELESIIDSEIINK